MNVLSFVKMQGSGNDFVLIEAKSAFRVSPGFVRNICDRKFGIGADGVLVISSSRKADRRMRIFNADGSEAEMCGNGARCSVLWTAAAIGRGRRSVTLETNAGLVRGEVTGNLVRLKMTDPEDIRLDIHVAVSGKDYEADYVNTGVPHAVIEVNALDDVPVRDIGRQIRHHKIFSPAGTNVDFIHRQADGMVRIRTYERGVEDETLACGTGSVASAIISVINHEGSGTQAKLTHHVSVKTKSGEVLSVDFKMSKKKVYDVWLEGQAGIVFEGKYFL